MIFLHELRQNRYQYTIWRFDFNLNTVCILIPSIQNYVHTNAMEYDNQGKVTQVFVQLKNISLIGIHYRYRFNEIRLTTIFLCNAILLDFIYFEDIFFCVVKPMFFYFFNVLWEMMLHTWWQIWNMIYSLVNQVITSYKIQQIFFRKHWKKTLF